MATPAANPAFEWLMRAPHYLSASDGAPATPPPDSPPAAGGARGFEISPSLMPHLETIRGLLAGKYGFRVRDDWMNALALSVRKRMQRHALSNIRNYVDHLLESCEERQQLIEGVLNHETHFNRTAPHFDALINTVLPQWRASGRERLRVCSLGCATGEEPYSLAICLSENLSQSEMQRVEITGLDLSRSALDRARAGLYADFQLRDLSPRQRERWFGQETAGWRVKPDLARRVRFGQHNLMAPLPCAGVDVIFCRNVLIYFHKPDVARVMREFHAALNPGGWLFLGHAESALDYSDLFKPLCASETVFYQRVAPVPVLNPTESVL